MSGYKSSGESELFSSSFWYSQTLFPKRDEWWGYSTATVENEVYIFGKFDFKKLNTYKIVKHTKTVTLFLLKR